MVDMSELPRFEKDGKTYFWDKRLKQLRNMDDPLDWMDVRMWGLSPSGDLVAFTDEGWETFKRARINDV